MKTTRRALIQMALAGPLVAQQKVVPGGARIGGTAPAPTPINNPQFVGTAEARIPADAFVYGVDIDGQPRAYSLNLLAPHQVVNDSTGDTNFSVVWSPVANSTAVYVREDDGQTVDLHVSGELSGGSPVLTAQPTSKKWSMMTSLPVGGGRQYIGQLALGERLTWGEWRAKFPQGRVLSVNGAQHAETSGFEDYWASKKGLDGLEARDTRLRTKSGVYAFRSRGVDFAVDWDATVGGDRWKVPGIGEVLLFRAKRDSPLRSTAAFRSGSGFRKRGGYWTEEATGTVLLPEIRDFTGSVVERLMGLDTYWYCWSLANPETELFK